MARARWRLRRLWSIESAQFEIALESQFDELTACSGGSIPNDLRQGFAFQQMANEQALSLVILYERSIRRSYERALAELEAVRKVRTSETANTAKPVTADFQTARPTQSEEADAPGNPQALVTAEQTRAAFPPHPTSIVPDEPEAPGKLQPYRAPNEPEPPLATLAQPPVQWKTQPENGNQKLRGIASRLLSGSPAIRICLFLDVPPYVQRLLPSSSEELCLKHPSSTCTAIPTTPSSMELARSPASWS